LNKTIPHTAATAVCGQTSGRTMIIIAFSHKTSKILPRIFCRRYRHCAPVVQNGDAFTMYQFTRPHQIHVIKLTSRDLQFLSRAGWRFIIRTDIAPQTEKIPHHAPTCVIFTKRVLGVRNMRIQRPDGLYKYLNTHP